MNVEKQPNKLDELVMSMTKLDKPVSLKSDYLSQIKSQKVLASLPGSVKNRYGVFGD